MPSMIRNPRSVSRLLARALIATSSAPEPAPTSRRKAKSAQRVDASGGSAPHTANSASVIQTRCEPARMARRPVKNIAGSAATATANRMTPSSAFVAPTPRRTAGRHAAQAPHHNPNAANAAPRRSALELQIPVYEVVLLQAAETFADLSGAHGAHTGDRLEIALRCAHDRLEVAEVGHDLLDDAVRQARDVRQDPEAARRHRMVERIDVARKAEQLGEPLRLEQLPVGQRMQTFQ